MKITGLDTVMKQLKEAEKAFAELDGETGTVFFDAEDPASIEAAISGMETLINTRMAGYEKNPFVLPIIEELKDKYRNQILEQAAETRLRGGEE